MLKSISDARQLSKYYFEPMFTREKLEQRGLLGKLDLWDLRGLLERLVLRDCVESPVLL